MNFARTDIFPERIVKMILKSVSKSLEGSKVLKRKKQTRNHVFVSLNFRQYHKKLMTKFEIRFGFKSLEIIIV